MPRIGKRILKSSLAVFLCFVIYLLRGEEGIVFYSCIAAVLCMQQDSSNTRRVAANRVVGTLIGGFSGMLVLIIEKQLVPVDLPIVTYAFISFMIIPIIYVTVLLKKTSASYISCVVFMSVTVSHGADINPYLFACNRMLDTLIGIFVAYGINCLHVPYRYRKDTLYVSTLDHALLQDNEQLSPYTKVKLRQLLEQEAAITIATSRTPATLLPILQGIPLKLPVITMNGAALYDCTKQQYTHCHTISQETMQTIIDILQTMQVNGFQHVIHHHMLHVYYGEFQNPLEEEYYHTMRRLPYKTYVYEPAMQAHASVLVLIMETHTRAKEVYDALRQQLDTRELTITLQPSSEHHGYSRLEIYSAQAGKKEAVEALMKTYGYENLCVFGYDSKDIPLLRFADHAYVVEEGEDNVKQEGEVIASFTQDSVIRKLDRLYHGHNK